MRDFRGLRGIGADLRNANQEQGNEEALGQSKAMMPSWPDGATGSSSQPSCSRYHPYARRKLPYEFSHPPRSFESSTVAMFVAMNVQRT